MAKSGAYDGNDQDKPECSKEGDNATDGKGDDSDIEVLS